MHVIFTGLALLAVISRLKMAEVVKILFYSKYEKTEKRDINTNLNTRVFPKRRLKPKQHKKK